jgi:hypothetical protein
VARGKVGLWLDGPVCSPPELKAWQVELEPYLRWVAAVERAAPTTAAAAQWLRRLYYSAPVGGRRFDRFLDTDSARRGAPVTTTDLGQSILDGLPRAGAVRVGGPAALDIADVSHVAVLLDHNLNGLGIDGTLFSWFAVGPNTAESILTWASDLAHAWMEFNAARRAARTAAEQQGQPWDEPTTAAGLVTPTGWLDTGIGRFAPREDLLGDLDAVIIAGETLPAGPLPLTTLLAAYYRPPAGGVGPVPPFHVRNRFQLFVERADPGIPHRTTAAGVVLDAGAKDAIREIIEDAAFWSELHERSGGALFTAAVKYFSVKADLGSPWGAAMLDTLADRFTTFLADGLAGRPVNWPAQPQAAVLFAGYLLPAVAAPPVADLEAAAQFYLNWKPFPHRPLPATVRWYQPVSLRNPAGTAARVLGVGPTAGTTRLQLDDFVDLSGVRPGPAAPADHRDLIVLDADVTLPSRLYRIRAVDVAAGTVTVEGAPVFPAGTSAWRIRLRPRLVLVDPFGGRLQGVAAQRDPITGMIDLGGNPDLNRVNVNLDTIYLAEDRARSSKVYRIVGVDPALPLVSVAGAPTLAAPSGWLIQSGVTDELRAPTNNFTPTATGCDHYDGALFVVYGDAVQGASRRWTSYTSVTNAGQALSSAVGNARYEVVSFRSGNAFINFAFKVQDPGANDTIAAASFYFDGVASNRRGIPGPWLPDGPVGTDQNGKGLVRLHLGNSGGAQTGSDGCLVSPVYFDLRAALIVLHQQERADLGQPADPDLNLIAAALTLPQSQALHAQPVQPAWTDRLLVEIILVRPDERTTA